MTETLAGTAYRIDHLHDDDVQAWSVLTNLLAEVDGTEEVYAPEDLAEELHESGVDPRQDTWAAWADDRLVGFGQVRVATAPDEEGRIRCWLGGGVHPDHRGHGIGRALMDRMEQRTADLARRNHPGRPYFWRAEGGLEGASVRRMLEHRGYRLARYFNEMKRALPGDPLETAVPQGVRLVTPGEGHEEPVRLAHNLAFRDHWGSSEQSPERWHDHWTSRAGRLPLSTVALDEADQVLAYVLCGQWVDRQLYVTIVGTVPSARGQGLARAALGRTIRLAADGGEHDVIELGVDSESPTGATRLYDGLGFTVDKVFATYQRDPG